MRELKVQLKEHSYDILIEDDLLFHLSFYISKVYQGKKIFIITDDCVAPLYLSMVQESLKKEYEVDAVIIPNGEVSKNITIYASICEQLLEKNIRRNHLLLALGGGVIGDLTGFVAATLYRGMPYIGIPTTLLSQMDSSIGGKTGIDFYQRKNILGAFKQPLMVLIDPKTLNTLSPREFNNGMGELIKHAVIGNPTLMEKLKEKPLINEQVIYESLLVKKNIVELDEFDLKERMLLNFGHTFGHAIELELGIKHGEAVALGMLMALQMGMDLKITNLACYDRVLQILKQYNLPCDAYDYKQYLNVVAFDKKNLGGTIRFILLEDIGKPILYTIEEDKLKEVLL